VSLPKPYKTVEKVGRLIDKKEILTDEENKKLIQAFGVELDIECSSIQNMYPNIFFLINMDIEINKQDIFFLSRKLLNYNDFEQIKDNFSLCINSLQDNLKITHIASMVSRNPATIRVNISGNPKDFLDYLYIIGSSKKLINLNKLLNNINLFVDNIIMTIDINQKVSSRLGLECYIANTSDQIHRWKDFLNLLVGLNLCSSNKKNSILEIFNLELKNGFFNSFTLCTKIVYEDDFAQESKFYLGFWKK
jgi:hypothetical protein